MLKERLNFNWTNVFFSSSFFLCSKFPLSTLRWKWMKIYIFILQITVAHTKFSNSPKNEVETTSGMSFVSMSMNVFVCVCVLLSFAHSDSYSSEMKIKWPSCRWTAKEEVKKYLIKYLQCIPFWKLYSIQLAYTSELRFHLIIFRLIFFAFVFPHECISFLSFPIGGMIFFSSLTTGSETNDVVYYSESV